MSRRVAIVTRRVDHATRPCAWCRHAIAATARRDAVYCSKRCRQAAWRFGRPLDPSTRPHTTTDPLRLAYADPPYPGRSSLYRGHPDYAGEVDHAALIARLAGYDGWALSTSASALPDVLALCPAGVRVAAWLRGAQPGLSAWPRSAWEPVIYAGGRRIITDTQPADALAYVARPRATDPDRVIGAKPSTFAYWLFALLGAAPGDTLDDLFPGSRGIARAWNVYSGGRPTTSQRDASPATSDASVDERDEWGRAA